MKIFASPKEYEQLIDKKDEKKGKWIKNSMWMITIFLLVIGVVYLYNNLNYGTNSLVHSKVVVANQDAPLDKNINSPVNGVKKDVGLPPAPAIKNNVGLPPKKDVGLPPAPAIKINVGLPPKKRPWSTTSTCY
jgi:hypothetical protein